MTEKSAYTAKVRTKGLENTGVTEDIAKTMYSTLGRKTLAIVEVEHKRQINDDDTGRSVELVITMFEPSTTAELDDYLRNLTRTMDRNRRLKSVDHQLQIDTLDDLEPTVEQVIAAGQQHIATTDDELPEPADNEGDPLEAGGDLHEDPNALADDPDDTTAQENLQPEDPWEYAEPEGQAQPASIASPFGDPAA